VAGAQAGYAAAAAPTKARGTRYMHRVPAAPQGGAAAARTMPNACKDIVATLRISHLDIQGTQVMASSTVFMSNRSQAVRLPKAVAFPEDVHQVDVLKIGRSRVIVPQGQRWDDLFQNGPRASGDFMVERAQPAAEGREPL
jgi:antitoxin VapB